MIVFQKLIITPVRAESLTYTIQLGSEIYKALKSVITQTHGASGEFLILLILDKIC